MKDKNDEIMNKELLKIKKEFIKCIINYKKYVDNAYLDAPIEILCLPKSIITILRRNKLIRVSDIVGRDLTKVKGIGKSRICQIESRLQQFIPM